MDTQKVSVPSRLAFDTSILAGQLAQSSIDMYKRDFAAYLYFAGTPDAALDAATLARWRTALANETEMSPNTINRMLSAVKRLMKEAASQGYATHEVAASFEQVKGVKVAAMKERTKTTARTRIAPESMRGLTSTPDTATLVGKRDAALLHTLASSGLRVSELASLTLTQVIKSGGGYLLRVRGKNDAEYRDAHLSPTAYKAIQKWIQARPVMSHYIFTSLAGRGESRATDKPMSEVAVWQTIKKYADQAGLENVKPHDLRRFVGTQLAKKDIRKAQKALGHKRIDTTARHYVLDELEVGLTDNLYEEDTMNIFCSHSSKDMALVQPLKDRIEAMGWEMYLFEDDSRPGEYIAAKLQQAIKASDIVLVLLTHTSKQSQYIHQEIGYAEAQKKPIIPLVERGVSSRVLGMLDGREYLSFQRGATSDEMLAEIFGSLHQYVSQIEGDKVMQDILVAFLVLAILAIGVAYLSQSGAFSLPKDEQ